MENGIEGEHSALNIFLDGGLEALKLVRGRDIGRIEVIEEYGE